MTFNKSLTKRFGHSKWQYTVTGTLRIGKCSISLHYFRLVMGLLAQMALVNNLRPITLGPVICHPHSSEYVKINPIFLGPIIYGGR